MNRLVVNHFRSSNFKFILLMLICSGCLSIKPAATKSGKKYFETFFVGEEGTQYFIKPIFFKGENSNENLFLDISFRYRNEIKDSATVNFSIKSSLLYKKIDSLSLFNKNNKIESDQVALLFNEKSKTGFTSRYSTRISLDRIKEIFNDDAWEMTIYNDNIRTSYKPHKKSIRAVNAVRDQIFVLM